MMPEHDELIEKMAEAFQVATFKPVTWVDAKRGVEGALQALLASLPEDKGDVYGHNLDYADCYVKLLRMKD